MASELVTTTLNFGKFISQCNSNSAREQAKIFTFSLFFSLLLHKALSSYVSETSLVCDEP